jgi:hypothetical protein
MSSTQPTPIEKLEDYGNDEIPIEKQTGCKCVFLDGDNVPEEFEYPYNDSDYVGLSFDGKELSLKDRHDGMNDGSSYGNGYGCAGCEANIDDGECECVGSPMCSTHKFLVKDYSEYLLHVEYMKE